MSAVDQGVCASIFTDIFQVSVESKPVFLLTFNYQGGDVIESYTVKCESEMQPSDLPGIATGLELLAHVHGCLMHLLNENDAEFFGDLFYDEEGDSKVIEMTLVAN